LIHEPLCRVLQDIKPYPSVKSSSAGGESLKVDKPLSPQAMRTVPDSREPSSRKGAQGSPGAGILQLLQPMPPWGRTLWAPPQCQNQPTPLEHLPQAPSFMYSGLPMGLSMVRAHPCHSLRRFHDSVHRSQSSYGTTQTLSRMDSTSVGS
jgi:hypothetical protein